MKKLLLILTISFSTLTANAQLSFDYGVKAGLNYNSIGDLNVTGGLIGFNETVNSNNNLGYHVGIFGQLNLVKFYIRPELIYTRNKSEFKDFDNLKISTLELPVLLGIKIIKPLNFYVGPSIIYNLDSDFSSFFDLEFENKISTSMNLGLAAQIQKFGIDIRYAKGLSENKAFYFDALPVDGLGYSIDTRPSQFLLSLSYRIN